ncbi:MAG TPA: hypothetical protein VGC46_12920 [Allosphingosinicella sp.]
MRPKRMPASALVRILAASTLFAAAACTSGHAAPSTQVQDGQTVKAMRGYSCTTAAAGRYRCARSLDRDAQRDAGAQAPASCSSCGNALVR